MVNVKIYGLVKWLICFLILSVCIWKNLLKSKDLIRNKKSWDKSILVELKSELLIKIFD